MDYYAAVPRVRRINNLSICPVPPIFSKQESSGNFSFSGNIALDKIN